MIERIRKNIEIILLIILSCIINMWNLWNEGLGNLYYSAGVYSMGQNFHAFFYNSLDSQGFISIDKPPLGFWIQVVFTKIFGFKGIVILMPEAIAGILSVYFMYRMMNKRFGKIVGVSTGLILALCPIFVVVSRNNTIDSMLIFALVLASEQIIKAAEKSSLKHLIFASILIGVGFNIKTMQAYMIIPAVYLTYLVFSNEKFIKKIASIGVSFAILILISFSWIAIVDFTSASERPFVGSSGTNSELELAFGNNGIGRLIGKDSVLSRKNNEENNKDRNEKNARNKGNPDNNDDKKMKRNPDTKELNLQNNRKDNKENGEGGATSLFRLFNNSNAGQISWFLLLAILVSFFALYKIIMRKLKKNSENIILFYFTINFIAMFGYFSFSNGVAHRYYLAMLAPNIAALVGIGIVFITQNDIVNKKALVIAFIATSITQVYIQNLYENWMNGIIIVYIFLMVSILFIMLWQFKKNLNPKFIFLPLAVLLIIPGFWSVTPILYGSNSQLPIAGPELINQGDLFDRHPDLSRLVEFLKENRLGSQYIASAQSAMDIGAELILQSKEAVMVLGGFNGGDKPIELEEYIKYIEQGKVRYAVISDNKRNSNDKITDWIIKNCAKVGNFDKVTLYKLTSS